VVAQPQLASLHSLELLLIGNLLHFEIPSWLSGLSNLRALDLSDSAEPIRQVVVKLYNRYRQAFCASKQRQSCKAAGHQSNQTLETLQKTP